MRTLYTLLLASSGLLAVQGCAVAGPISLCDATPGNLVANCGFETGDFTSWTLSGNDVPFEFGNLFGVEGVDPFDGISPNSGLNQVYIADLVSNATTLSQTLATQIGQAYQISWFLAQDTDPVSPYSNLFSASFGGNTLATLTGLPAQGYTEYTYRGFASAASATLSFTVGNDIGESLVDDISVVAVATPEPGTWLLSLIGAGLCGFAVRRRALSHS